MYDPSKSPMLSRPAPSRRTKSFYHIIYEGITERGYVSGIIGNKMLSQGIIIKHIFKDGIDKDVSDRKEMIHLVRDYEIYLTTGKNTPRRYITAVLNQYLEGCNEEYRIRNEASFNDFVDVLCDFRAELLSRYSSDNKYVKDGFVIPSSGLFDKLAADCVERFGIGFTFSPEDKLFENDHIDGSNSFYIMFDRDYHSELRTHEMYRECLDLCDEFGYKPLVSTPQFELWMLMHMCGADFGNPSFDRYKQHVLDQLQMFDYYSRTSREKFMTRERFNEYYKDNIGYAIEMSKNSLFTSDPVLLMDHAGTNLGQFFESIIKPEFRGI